VRKGVSEGGLMKKRIEGNRSDVVLALLRFCPIPIVGILLEKSGLAGTR
jgi:hypothetical protein